MKTLNTNKILVKALANGILGWVVFALITCLKADISLGEAFVAPASIYAAVAAFIGCYIGYRIRENRAASFIDTRK